MIKWLVMLLTIVMTITSIYMLPSICVISVVKSYILSIVMCLWHIVCFINNMINLHPFLLIHLKKKLICFLTPCLYWNNSPFILKKKSIIFKQRFKYILYVPSSASLVCSDSINQNNAEIMAKWFNNQKWFYITTIRTYLWRHN